MDTTPHPAQTGSRFIVYATDVINPPASSTAQSRSLLRARQIVALVGIFATLVQIVIWLMIAILSSHLDSPWWLWTAIAAAGLVGLLTLLEQMGGESR